MIIYQCMLNGRQHRDLFALLNDDTVSQGVRDVLILTLLPALHPPVARVKKGKGFWRPTIVESMNGFIRHMKTLSDLQPEIDRRIEQMNQLKQRVQTYIIIVGPELMSIQNLYVIIDNTIYYMESILKAVNICFKICHALHARYPVKSEQIWLLLQKCIYNMKTT
ncbi:uncharacterized protein LOC124407957 [Diprion similis]|uniref:uncharacterized protein LOC124407957 n=1 Tax=Diprion similis TaxID=362088 RepID=UPI001EF78437|nr:uncharacterized protein LOC124407957 [Diprion similis]